MGKNEKKNEKDEGKSKPLFLLVFFIFSAATILLGILCLYGINASLVRRYIHLFIIVVCVLVCLLCALCLWATLTNREVLTKSLLSIYVFLLFALSVCIILQKTGFFEVIESAESLQAYLQKAGIWMPVFYVLLQFLQVVVLPIPSVVSTVAGVALFGAFRAMLYSLIGILFGSFVAFFVGRKLGYSAVSWMVGEEVLKKWQKKLKGKDNLFLTLMFILPVFPDDVLCLLAGLSSMSTKYFSIVIIVSRILAIATTCYFVDFIPFNTWWGITLWGGFILGVSIAFVLVYKNLDKLQAKFNRRKEK